MRAPFHGALALTCLVGAIAVPVARDQAGGDRAKAEVLKAESALQAAVVTDHDAAAAGLLLADDLIVTHSNGAVGDKANEIARMPPKGTRRPSLREDIAVRVYGDAAVVTGRYRQVKTNGEMDLPKRFTNVWVNRDQRWQQVASQITTIPTE